MNGLLNMYRTACRQLHEGNWFNHHRDLTLTQYRMCIAVKAWDDFILKGQLQMMADYLMLELLERGEL